jgi:hypothetical protein
MALIGVKRTPFFYICFLKPFSTTQQRPYPSFLLFPFLKVFFSEIENNARRFSEGVLKNLTPFLLSVSLDLYVFVALRDLTPCPHKGEFPLEIIPTFGYDGT